MRVGISAFALGNNLGGIETRVRNLIRCLPMVDPDGEYTLFLSPPLPADPIAGSARMRKVTVGSSNAIVRNSVTFPLALARNRVDAVHVQLAAPFICPTRIVVTVDDLIFERYPQFFTRAVTQQFRALVPLTIRRASAVITPSEYAKNEIVRRYGTSPDKITVARNAVDPVFSLIDDEQSLLSVRERYGTSERFILAVGNLEPRKNLRTLIAAYVQLRKQDKIDHRLVLVGKQAWLFDDIFVAARESGYEKDLIFTDYVSTADLVALYNAADVFVFPSIAEGFGIPILEAMACGTPVVSSNSTCLPEVVGDAGILVDVMDVMGYANAIDRIVNDRDLSADLAVHGQARCKQFSWEESARITRNVYWSVIA